MTRPTVGRAVHYVARGSADGRFPSVCRAADVTEVDPDDPDTVGLFVKNPTGLFMHSLGDGGVGHHAGHRPDGGPGAVCNGNDSVVYPGGSWHWPARVEG